MADNNAGQDSAPWELGEDTLLVKRNLDEATRGSHAPRPLVVPIYNSSTYLFENAEEGKELSMNHSNVRKEVNSHESA